METIKYKIFMSSKMTYEQSIMWRGGGGWEEVGLDEILIKISIFASDCFAFWFKFIYNKMSVSVT